LEQKKNGMIALIIAAVIAVAVMSSFFLPVFFSRTPKVTLPNLSAQTDQSNLPDGGQNSGGDHFVKVDVTPETVQNVIATLRRPTSYYRELAVETIWGEGTADRSVTSIKVWEDDGFTKSETAVPGARVRSCIVGNGSLYIWYGTEIAWYQATAEPSSADLAQQMPTYEDVLSLSQDDIADTGYEIWNSLSCIYVEAKEDALGYLERYWVDVQSGLLVSAETVKNGMVVYRMTSNTMLFPIPQDASFQLPDGTVLHEVLQT
jgi:hypothetical protein